jgi:predicted RNA binding protein YcfA (HicA-like mRNA interferase family)
MPPVPILPPSEVIKIFQRLGWQMVRQKGSHIIMTRPGHMATLSIPNHPEVARGTLRSLIAKAGLTIEQFLAASNK